MTKVVYTSAPTRSFRSMLHPACLIGDLVRYRELILSFVVRDFQALYRGTYLGVAWAIVSPLIMLSLFTFVFGHVFNGRFTPNNPNETSLDFALALFVGLSFFNVIGQTMGSAPSILPSNATYVKSLAFPVQVLPVVSVASAMITWFVGIVLCLIAFLAMNGFLYWSALALVPLGLAVALMAAALAWLLAALAVFVRDIPSIVAPLMLILMFMSSVFFPIEAVPRRARWLVEINPLALIIDGARGCVLYGRWPGVLEMVQLLLIAAIAALVGYAVFMRLRAAFADVM